MKSDENNNDKKIELTNSCQKTRKSSNPITQFIDNKCKHL